MNKDKKDFKPRGTKSSGRKPARKTFAPTKGKLSQRISQDGPAAKKMVKTPIGDEPIRLNKYLSMCGVASRREADGLIKIGLVEVNGAIVTEMGFKVKPGDKVKYDGATLTLENKRYFLLNKPKNVLCEASDEKGRRTVVNLVKHGSKEKVYPVGKLDRLSTGLVLLTNDGDMAKRLIHPKNGVNRLYEVQLKEKVKAEHLEKMVEGFEYETGWVKADEVAFVGNDKDSRKIGIRVSSMRNKLIQKLFTHFGYTITKIDRVMYAGLSKKNLSRGDFRELTETEVNFLKMIR